MKKSAFTLVELLVVIAIITILAALLLPALQGVMDASYKAQCASNLRQIDLGVLNYVNDNDGVFPAHKDNCTSWPYIFGDWGMQKTNFYNEYLPQPKLYYCPVDLRQSDKAVERMNTLPNYPSYDWIQIISYTYFFGEDAWYGGNKRQGKIRISQVKAASRSTVLADLMRFGSSAPYYIGGSWNHRGDYMSTCGGNMAYVDGHVKWMQGFDELLKHRQKMKNSDQKSYAAEQPHDP